MKEKYSWFNPKLESIKIEGLGDGVLAKKGIKKDELLAVFGGHIISLSEEKKLPSPYNDLGIQISDDFVLSSLSNKELTDCFNHSCDPNSGIKGQIFLVAMRNITKGEQVTFDYAMCLCNNTSIGFIYDTECLCGSKECRGRITGDDWRNKVLQKKYKGYFQQYLEQKINAIRK